MKNISSIQKFEGVYALQGLMVSHFLRLFESFPADKAGSVSDF